MNEVSETLDDGSELTVTYDISTKEFTVTILKEDDEVVEFTIKLEQFDLFEFEDNISEKLEDKIVSLVSDLIDQMIDGLPEEDDVSEGYSFVSSNTYPLIERSLDLSYDLSIFSENKALKPLLSLLKKVDTFEGRQGKFIFERPEKEEEGKKQEPSSEVPEGIIPITLVLTKKQRTD